MNTNMRGWVLGVALAGLAGGAVAQAPTTNPSPPPDHPWQGHGDGEHEPHDWGGPDGERGHWHHHHHWHHHWARGPWGHDHGGWGPGGRGGPGLLGNLRELDLTQAQREQIHSLMDSERAQWKRPEGAGHGKNPMAALENPGDPGYAAAVQAAKQRASERIQAMSDLQTKIYNVLTPQQKTELSRRLAERQARWEKWQQGHDAHGPAGGGAGPLGGGSP